MLHTATIAQQWNLSAEDIAGLPLSSGHYRISWTFPDRIFSDFGNQHPKALPQGLVVDAGCSYGFTSRDLCYIYPEHHVVGLDIEDDRLPSESEIPEGLRSRLSYRRGDLFRLHEAFEPSTVACVYMMNNLTHLVSERFSPFADPIIMKLLADRLEHILVDGGFVCVSGSGQWMNEFVWAVFQKTDTGLKPVRYNEHFNTSSGLVTLCRAFNLDFHPSGM